MAVWQVTYLSVLINQLFELRFSRAATHGYIFIRP